MSQPETAPAGPAPTIGRADATRVAIASAVAAGSSTLIVAGAPRLLADTAQTTVFLTFWSALFTCFGLLSGVSVETTRAVTAASAPGAAPADASHPRVGLVGALVGAALGLVVAAAAPLWGPAVFVSTPVTSALLVALGVAAYAVHSVVVGSLAGRGRWAGYATLIAADSTVRLLLVAGALVAGSVVGAAAGAVAAAFTWAALLLLSRDARTAATTRADVPWRPYLGRLGAASLATGASALLVVGFPTLLAVTTPRAEYVLAAPLILALTLTRAPLMIPLNAYQGVAVAHVVRHRDRGLRALLPVLRAVVAVGVVGAGAAWLVGPWLLGLVGGDGYRLSGGVLAGLTLGATGLAVLTLTGAVCQALTRHGAFVAGWLTAVAVALVLLLLPLPLEVRAVLALGVGPLAGIVVHLVALRRTPTSPAPAAGDDRTTPTQETP